MAIVIPSQEQNTWAAVLEGIGGGLQGAGKNYLQRSRDLADNEYKQGLMNMNQQRFDADMEKIQKDEAGWREFGERLSRNNGQVTPDMLSLPGDAGSRAFSLAQFAEKLKQRQMENNFRRQQIAAQYASQNRPNWQIDTARGVRFNPKTGVVEPLMMQGEDGEMVPWTPQKTPNFDSDMKMKAAEALGVPYDQRTPEQHQIIEVAKGLKLLDKSAGTNKKNTSSDYANIVLEDIGRSKKLAKDYYIIPTTGIGGEIFAKIPGTAAHNLESTLNTIRASIGFDRLQDMRDNSATGGALGQVSNLENELLQAALGSLAQSQSEDQFLENLDRVERHYLNIIHGKGNWGRDQETGEVYVGFGIGDNPSGTSQDFSSMSNEDLLRGL